LHKVSQLGVKSALDNPFFRARDWLSKIEKSFELVGRRSFALSPFGHTTLQEVRNVPTFVVSEKAAGDVSPPAATVSAKYADAQSLVEAPGGDGNGQVTAVDRPSASVPTPSACVGTSPLTCLQNRRWQLQLHAIPHERVPPVKSNRRTNRKNLLRHKCRCAFNVSKTEAS